MMMMMMMTTMIMDYKQHQPHRPQPIIAFVSLSIGNAFKEHVQNDVANILVFI